jgi:hypothetical protein
MKDLFWKLFEKSGNIDAFLAYREYKNFEQASTVGSSPEKRD